MVDEIRDIDYKRCTVISNLIIAEYNVLRKELDIYHEHQKEMMNFLFLTVIAMVSFIGVIFSLNLSPTLSIIFLLFPLIFSFLTFLYTERTIRIIGIADYIHNFLRRKVIKLFGENIWQWEIYKDHAPLVNKRIALVLDKLRWLIFIVPSIFSIIIFIIISYDIFLVYLFIFIPMLVIVIISIIFSIVTMFIVEETTGIKDRKDIIILDDFEDPCLDSNSDRMASKAKSQSLTTSD